MSTLTTYVVRVEGHLDDHWSAWLGELGRCAPATPGMRLEVHAVRESLHRSGRWLDTVGYALLAEEWNP